MKESKAKFRTIERTILPNLNAQQEDFNNTDLRYFYKIKRNIKLEDWQREKDNNGLKRINNRDKYSYSVSPRLRMLSKAREIIDRNIQAPQTTHQRPPFLNSYYKKKQTFNEHFFNQNRFFFVKQDGFQFSEQENLGKNINGTALGIFSQQTITQKLQNSRKKNENKQVNNVIMTRELDSDNDIIQQKQLELKKASKRTRKLSLVSRNSSITSNNKAENRLFDMIYGDQQFLDKYKLQQMALMEKNSFYKQKKLTLDYKNQWRI